MITQFYLSTLANNNLKRNLKKQFPFNNASINKILCHGCYKDDRLAHWKSYMMPTDVLDTHTHSTATERLRMAIPQNASSIGNEDSVCITKG